MSRLHIAHLQKQTDLSVDNLWFFRDFCLKTWDMIQKIHFNENELNIFAWEFWIRKGKISHNFHVNISFLFYSATSYILVKVTLLVNLLLTPDITGEVLTVNAIKLFNKQQRTQKQRLISLKNITLKLVTMCPNLLVCRVT